MSFPYLGSLWAYCCTWTSWGLHLAYTVTSQEFYLILFLGSARAKSCLQVFKTWDTLWFHSVSDKKTYHKIISYDYLIGLQQIRFINPVDSLNSLCLSNNNNFLLKQKKRCRFIYVINFLKAFTKLLASFWYSVLKHASPRVNCII